jgi:hypothetical protein
MLQLNIILFNNADSSQLHKKNDPELWGKDMELDGNTEPTLAWSDKVKTSTHIIIANSEEIRLQKYTSPI